LGLKYRKCKYLEQLGKKKKKKNRKEKERKKERKKTCLLEPSGPGVFAILGAKITARFLESILFPSSTFEF